MRKRTIGIFFIWVYIELLLVMIAGGLYSGENACSAVDPRSEFPMLTLYDGVGTSDLFPSDKSQLVFLGFQTKAKGELLLWHRALLHERQIAKSIPRTVLGVFPSWMAWSITREPLIALCRKVIPQEALPYFRIAFFDKEKLGSQLGLPSGEDPLEHIHVFYVDEKKKIRWQASGAPTRELLAQLTGAVADRSA